MRVAEKLDWKGLISTVMSNTTSKQLTLLHRLLNPLKPNGYLQY
jgi:hypothetical protein